MSRLKLVGIVRILSLVVLVLVAGLGSVDPVEAKGLKKLKKTLGIKEKSPEKNMHQVGESPTPDTKQAPQGAVRDVLLITEPINQANVSPGSTLAFIRFEHIQNQVPDYWKSYEVTEEIDSYVGLERVRVSKTVDDSTTCAKQVESALAQHLADLNLFKVVTRNQIDSVLKEQNFNYTGRVDTGTSARLGKLIGADILIYGQVQLCVNSQQNYQAFADIASGIGNNVDKGSKNWIETIATSFKAVKPEKQRAFILAQIQMIDADSGKRVFTTSLSGEFSDHTNAFSVQMEPRELVYRAADVLANRFIDDFLARQEARYLALYVDSTWDFLPGVDWIQLGHCDLAEKYFTELYRKFKDQMTEKDIARLMYNHGVALICANRSQEAASRLWASLRLTNDENTFKAIEFSNDTVDRGRRVQAENDTIINDVSGKLYSRVSPELTDTLGPIAPMDSPEG